MAKRRRPRKIAATAGQAINPHELKLAIAILVFALATAFSAIYKLGNVTILFGLITAGAALVMAAKNK